MGYNPWGCNQTRLSTALHSIRGILKSKRGSGFSCGSVVKNLPANAEDMGSIPGSRRSPGEGNGNSFQYSCLEILWTGESGVLQSMNPFMGQNLVVAKGLL